MNPAEASPATAAPPPALWIRRRERVALGVAFLGPPLLAWAYFLAAGLPPTAGNADPANPHGPHQFPAWLRAWHYLNLVLVVLLGWTGGRILAARPWLAWSEGGQPWLRWRAGRGRGGDDPAVSDLGRLRFGHALLAVVWAASGALYPLLTALTGQAERLFPRSSRTVPEAWAVFVQYSTFHLPLDPDGYYRYNSLQLLSYAIVMLVIAPLIALTGLATSPAFGGAGLRLARLFGNREAARSVHHLAIVGYLAFLAVHVGFVVLYAAWLNGHHVVLGTDETGLPGWLIGGAGLLGIGLTWATARRLAR